MKAEGRVREGEGVVDHPTPPPVECGVIIVAETLVVSDLVIDGLIDREGLLVRDGEVEGEREMEGEVEREREPEGDLVGLADVDWLKEEEGLEVVVSPADPRGRRRRRRRTKARGNLPFMVKVSKNRWVYFKRS